MSVEAQADTLAFYQTAMHDESEREAQMFGGGKPKSSPQKQPPGRPTKKPPAKSAAAKPPGKPVAKRSRGGRRK